MLQNWKDFFPLRWIPKSWILWANSLPSARGGGGTSLSPASSNFPLRTWRPVDLWREELFLAALCLVWTIPPSTSLLWTCLRSGRAFTVPCSQQRFRHQQRILDQSLRIGIWQLELKISTLLPPSSRLLGFLTSMFVSSFATNISWDASNFFLLDGATLPKQTHRNRIPLLRLHLKQTAAADMNATSLVFIQDQEQGQPEQKHLCKKDFWMSGNNIA